MFRCVIGSILKAVVAASGKNKLGVLTYHRVGESYNQKFMDEYLFEQQLIWLKRYFNPVGLDEGLLLQQQGRLPKRAVTITIDDGYLDSYTTIFPLLKKHGLEATFFISTSGVTKGYLWDELISSAILTLATDVSELKFEGQIYDLTTHNARLTCASIIVLKIKYCSLKERERLIELLLKQIGKPELSHQFLNEDQILSLYQAGMGIGAHTVNHPILTSEKDNIARAEILESKQSLEKIIQAPVKFFAYPNGKSNIDFNDKHQNIVKECGFDAAFTTDWGCIDSSSVNYFGLKRFTPWDVTEAKFSLRLALNFSHLYTRLFN
jgi:peptidoglycan/xylan/chitin deacetylase (PgdA/CDA1 family)